MYVLHIYIHVFVTLFAYGRYMCIVSYVLHDYMYEII